MSRIFSLKFQLFPSQFTLILSFLLLFPCHDLWAIQHALVVKEKAVIYADEQMTSPIGFIRRGKKIKVGNVARNKAQVYPIVVSGKVAYIRVLDVSTEKESVDSDRLVAERFMKATKPQYRTRFILSYLSFSSEVSQNAVNDAIEDGDSLGWMGGGMRGEIRTQGRWDFLLIANYLKAAASREELSVAELGVGAAWRFLELGGFSLRARAEAMFVPFAMYSVGSDFRKRSMGFTYGAGFDAHYQFTENFGLEVAAGIYTTKLQEFDVPSPYKSISPSFAGTRTSLGVTYLY